MPGTILAIVTSDSADGGAVLTFAFPVALFVVVAAILYLRFSRPHKRVPERRILVPARASVPDAGPGNVSDRGASPADALAVAICHIHTAQTLALQESRG